MSVVHHDRVRWLATCVLIHEDGLRAWLRRWSTGLGADPDDVVQESYAILAGRARVDDIADPRAYLFQVARSVVLRSVRRGRVVGIGSSADLALLQAACELPSPEREVAGRRELSRVAGAVRAMPPQARRVFWMRRVEGLSQREIAASLGLSENTVEKHMVRALRFLRLRFEDGGKDGPDLSRDRTGDATGSGDQGEVPSRARRTD